MNPVGKALWFIESHFAQEITLEDIAKSGGVSRYQRRVALPYVASLWHRDRPFGYALCAGPPADRGRPVSRERSAGYLLYRA